MRVSFFALGLASTLLAGCAGANRVHIDFDLRERMAAADTTAVTPGVEETFRVLLVGDAGAPETDEADPLLATLRHHVLEAGPNSATIFLGDNIYSDGLPPVDDPRRPEAEARLRSQLDAVADAPGRVFFIPGNHDWKHSQPGGRAQLREQEIYVENVLGEGSFLPSNGFPGPVEVELTDDLTLLAIDTEWWLGVHERGEGQDEESGASVGADEDFLIELVEAVEDADDERVLVVGHHPILSEGSHSGVAPLSHHLFPLLAVHPAAYVPLPVIGSLVVATKRFQGEDRQDLGHPRYRALAEALKPIFASHEALVYASGHDHSLQMHEQPLGRGVVRQLVSGAGSEGDPVAARAALFATGQRGFMVVRYFSDGSATMEAIVPSETPEGESLLTAPLLDRSAKSVPFTPVGGPASAEPDSASVPASTQYADVSAARRWLIGSHYRETWATPVRAPVLDFDTEAGGLTVLRSGGDRQSQSLFLEGGDGRVYRLRSIDKDPANPFSLGFTFGVAHEWGQDATSGLYPFGALVAARLSDAAGLYHTNPRVVVVPDDPRLGRYRESLRGKLMWFEEHPDESGEGQAFFGNAENLVGSAKLRRELDGDADHRVDAPFYLRARLFDMLIGDWDRHRDQWRWGAFEPGVLDTTLTGDAATKGKVYRPVARDRDFALNDRNGLIFRLGQPHLPKLQGLTPEYVNINGLTEGGRPQDLRLMAPLDRADWRRVAEDLRAALTDEAIEAALQTLPPEAYALDAERLRKALRSRRDELVTAAMAWYNILSPIVDVVGTQDKDAFDLEWLPEGNLRLTVRQLDKDGDGLVLWTRILDPEETHEVRIWARGDDDEITIRGDRGRSSLRVRILPGAGEDLVNDRTDGAGIAVYEGRGEGGDHQLGPEAHLDRSNRIPESAYGYIPRRTNTGTPLVTVGYNADDGLRLGGGVDLTYLGFGHNPYARRHRIQAAIASSTGGGYFRYHGQYTDALGQLDLGLRASAQTPLAFQNFFGYGDGVTPTTRPASDFRVQMAEVLVEPYAERTFPRGLHAWIGPSLVYTSPRVDSVGFNTIALLPARDLQSQTLVGAAAGLNVEAVDRSYRPTQGARFDAWVRARQGLQSDGHTYARLGTSLSLYMTHPAVTWATLAVRGGGEHVVGTFPFYDAATVGGGASVRGYRSDRFAGRSALYATVEPRLVLSRFPLPIVTYGEFGVLGFADAGRVWSDGLATSWHMGAGGGVWLALPGATNLTLTYDSSPERTGVALRMGFAL
ncbi:MAG: metallophosphoesterase [Rubricoccaceae bacterium]